MQGLHRAPTPPPPPSKGYGPFWSLALCRYNLWPALRMELGQEGWLRLSQITSKEDLSWPVIRYSVGVTNVVRHCLQEIPVPEVWVHPRDANRCPLGGKQTVDSLDQWDCVMVLEMQGLHTLSEHFPLSGIQPVKSTFFPEKLLISGKYINMIELLNPKRR